MTCEILFPCLFGSEIIVASEKLSSSLMHSQWLDQSESFKANVKILMEYMKKPIKLSAVGVFDVNLENFMKICNSAYSLFAVFKKINAKVD